MRQFVLGFATIVMATSAHAGDLMNFKVLGFSADNKKVAVASTVVQDGSGNGFAKVSVIDVAKNSLLASSSGRDEADSGSEAKALSIALAKLNLSKYGITAGKNLGQTLIERLPTDHSMTSNTVFSVNAWAEGGSSASLPKFELDLKSAAASAECYGEGPAEGMTLTLKSVEGAATSINKVLQQDSSVLPKSRGCATKYGVTKVVKSGNSLLVAVQYSTPGFEGPNQETIAVTTQVELK